MSALLPALAWALLDFVWQGLLIGWGAALALAAMRKSSPQSRYAVACAALLLCAALPLAGVVQRVAEAQQLVMLTGEEVASLRSILRKAVWSANPGHR